MFSLRFGAVQRFGAFKCGRNFREMKTSIFYRVHSLLIITKAQKQLLLPPGCLSAMPLPLPHARPAAAACLNMPAFAGATLAALDIQFCILQQMRVLPYLVGVQK